MAMPTDEPQAEPAPSARSKAPDPRADTPKIHGDTGKPSALSKKWSPSSTRLPSIIVGVVVATVAALSIWYLVRGEPLLVRAKWTQHGLTSQRGSMDVSPRFPSSAPRVGASRSGRLAVR